MLNNPLKRSELRRYRRIPLDAPARILINNQEEHSGAIVNISPGDLAVQVDAQAAIGDVAVCYIQGLDVLEGRVARVFPDGFAMSFRLSQSRRTILTEQLMLRANKQIADDLNDRRGVPRHKVGDQRMVCRLPDGGSLFVKAVDISVHGIAVESQRKPPVGTAIHVGRMSGMILRHTPRGFVVVYDQADEQSADDAQSTRHLRAV